MTEQDRELLELAAKAAGYEIEEWNACGFAWTKEQEWWNPLTDDGDALRLAVKLGLSIRVDRRSGFSWIKGFGGAVPHDVDPYAATRRAIVRAAAEIGRNMP